MIDLDRFKLINDAKGHDVGDEVLRRVARAMVAATPDGAAVTRLGGDEFAVLLPGCDVEEARGIASEIVDAVAGVELADLGVLTSLGASVGCSHRHEGSEDPRELLRSADRALYKAKTEGVGRVCAEHL
jgi:diguanylate cyclase (GGDEF)-like protein